MYKNQLINHHQNANLSIGSTFLEKVVRQTSLSDYLKEESLLPSFFIDKVCLSI